MKFADLLKQSTANTSAAVITLGAAATGFRTLAQAIADGELTAGDQSTFMVRDSAGKYEFSLFTVTNSTTLTRAEIRRSSNGGAAETFGSGVTVANIPDSEWLSQLLGASDTVDLSQLSLLNSLADSDSVPVLRGSALYLTLGSTLKSYLGGASAPAATVSGVTVSPSAPSVAGGATQTFTASVAGTNSPAQTVTWTASAGSITSGGVFTAPAATGSAQTITITARSTVDTTKTGTATVTVPATGTPTPTVSSVTVSPSTANVAGGATQQFSATVAGTNSPSQAVTWSANAGTINSSGLFTAPAATSSAQTITVTATSQQDGTKSGAATATVPASGAPQAREYTFTYYGSASILSAYDATNASSSGGKKFAPSYQVFSNPGSYFDIRKTSDNSVPANATGFYAGWSTSSTTPPPTLPGINTVASGAGNDINAMTPMSKPGAFSVEAYVWLLANGNHYLWLKEPNGTAFCWNPTTPLVVSGV